MSIEVAMTEKDLISYLSKVIAHYTTALNSLEKNYKDGEEAKATFPEKYISSKDEDYENLLILAANLKHQMVSLNKMAMGIYSSVSIELDYNEAQILLNHSELALKQKGFDKITDTLRQSYLSSSKEIKKIRVLKGKIRAVMEASDDLIKAFESDEVNFRKFLDMKNKLRGL